MRQWYYKKIKDQYPLWKRCKILNKILEVVESKMYKRNCTKEMYKRINDG
jgi:hypothetical protein